MASSLVASPVSLAQLRPEGLADQALAALRIHRLLTVEQLRQMLTPDTAGTANWSRRLNQLRRAGLVDTQTPEGAWRYKVWYATRAGQRHPLDDHTPRTYPVPASSLRTAHTLALNETGLAFIRGARARGDECDWTSWEHEVAHTFSFRGRRRNTLIADAVLTYTTNRPGGHSRLHQWFIEMDRATMDVHRLVNKIRTYAAYHRWTPARPDSHGVGPGEPAWRARYADWPTLCVVIGANPAKTPDAIERRIDQTITLCGADPLVRSEGICVLVCLFETLIEHGPWAHIWWRLDAPHTPVDIAGQSAR